MSVAIFGLLCPSFHFFKLFCVIWFIGMELRVFDTHWACALSFKGHSWSARVGFCFAWEIIGIHMSALHIAFCAGGFVFMFK